MSLGKKYGILPHLQCNGLGDEAIQELAEVVKENRRLTCLDIPVSFTGSDATFIAVLTP